MKQAPLHTDLDAMRWAKEFIDVVDARDSIINIELMHTWFANALMCGWDGHRWKYLGNSKKGQLPRKSSKK